MRNRAASAGLTLPIAAHSLHGGGVDRGPGDASVSRTTIEHEPRNDNRSVDVVTAQPEPERLPAARIALLRFALVEIEQLPEDGPLVR